LHRGFEITTDMGRLTFLNCAYRFLQGTIFFYLAIILKDLHLSGWAIGAILALYSFTPLIVSLPAGIMNDRMNSRLLITTALVGYCFFYLGLLVCKTFYPLLLLFFLGGASANFLSVSLQALALKIVGDEHKGRRLGAFHGYSYIAYAAGLVAGGFLLMSAESAVFLVAGGAFSFLMLSLFALFLEESTVVNINLLDYAKDFGRRDVLFFCLVFSIFSLHWGSESSSLSLFLRDYFGLSKFRIGLFMAPAIACLGGAAILSGWLVDRNMIDLKKLVIIAFMASGIGQALMVVNNVYLSMVMRILHEIGDGMALLTFSVALSRMFGVEKIGGLSSLVTFTNILASSLAALFFSRVGEVYGYQYPIIIGGLAAVVASIMMLTESFRIADSQVFFQIHHKQDHNARQERAG
jgi:MFS family permease